jgi:glyoxylase-like metal-dependent hydrolase (beta-lactamase superfamily II)
MERVSVKDSWFEVYLPAPGVFAIYEPHQSEETIAYLITGDRRALLFDTGMGISDIKKTSTELTKLPITVLNSHTHADHVGGNWQFSTIYSLDTPFTRTNAKGSRDDAQGEIAPSEICGQLPAGFDPKSYATRPWTTTKTIHDGERIDLGNRQIEVIATPGHTPDAISLLDRANGLLFTGDTYYPGTIWLYRPETNLAAYRSSIEKLAALVPQLKLVLGAHNVPSAKPDVLSRLVAAFDEVQSGKVKPQRVPPDRAIYKSGEFTFLMRPVRP